MSDSVFKLTTHGATRNFLPPPDPDLPKKLIVECVHLRLISSLTPFELIVLHELMEGEIQQIILEHKLHCSHSKLNAYLIKLSTLEKHPAYEGRVGGKIVLGCL